MSAIQIPNTIPPPSIRELSEVLGGCHVRGSFLDRLALPSAFPVVTNLPLGSIHCHDTSVITSGTASCVFSLFP